MQVPQAFLALAFWPRVARADRPLLGLAVALLLALPLASFGPANDLVSRGSAPALAIVVFVFAVVATRLDPVADARSRAAVLLVVAFGLCGPLFEIVRAVTRPTFAASACDLMQANVDFGRLAHPGEPLGLPTNYVAPPSRMPSWLIEYAGARREPFVDATCWPDHPLLGRAASTPSSAKEPK